MLSLVTSILTAIASLLMVEPFNYFVGLGILCGILSLIYSFIRR